MSIKLWVRFAALIALLSACNLFGFNQAQSSLPTTQQELTLSETAPDSGVSPEYDAVQGKSKDGQTVRMDITLLFKIDPAMADRILKKWGQTYGTDFLVPTLRHTTEEAISYYTARQLYGEGRIDLANRLQTALKQNIEAEGFIYNQMLIRNISFDPIFIATVESEIVAAQATARHQPTPTPSATTRMELVLSGIVPSVLPGYETVETKTSDGQLVHFDIRLVFSVDPSWLTHIQDKWGDDYQTLFLAAILRQTTQTVASLYTSRQLYGVGRVDFIHKLQAEVNKKIAAEGFIYRDLIVNSIKFEETFLATAESEVHATQQAVRLEATTTP